LHSGHTRESKQRQRELPDEYTRLHNFSDMRILPAMHRRDFSAESKQKLWRPCREARALGL